MAGEELFAMTEDELWGALQIAVRAECRAVAAELASFGENVPDDAATAVRIERARRRWEAVAEELRRRG
jgi:hypothetical protein